MKEIFTEMDEIFQRTKQALTEFKQIISPIINNATDEHQRLYWHHIYEEEDHRSDRLDILLPNLETHIDKKMTESDHHHGDFVHLLQDISLEKFGLHNFLEHLDLSLFQFNGTESEEKIKELRSFTYNDYQRMKGILETLNQAFKGGLQFNTSIPTDEKEGIAENLKIEAYSGGHTSIPEQQPSHRAKKTLTVGSLKT